MAAATLVAGCVAGAAVAAPAEPSGACKAVGEYVRLINAGRYEEIARLFAPDALYFSYQAPEPLRGPAAIAGFYKALLAGARQEIRAASYVGDARHCVVELELRSPDYDPDHFVLVSVDHFSFDAQGRISRFAVYTRPGIRPGAAVGATR